MIQTGGNWLIPYHSCYMICFKIGLGLCYFGIGRRLATHSANNRRRKVQPKIKEVICSGALLLRLALFLIMIILFARSIFFKRRRLTFLNFKMPLSKIFDISQSNIWSLPVQFEESPLKTFQFVCNDEEIFPLDPRSTAFHYLDPKWRHKSETTPDFFWLSQNFNRLFENI